MLLWGAGLTVVLIAVLTLLGWLLDIRTPVYRTIFFLTLALWQSALTVVIYLRRGPRSRPDCLGSGLISVLVTVIYVLIRYSQSWRAVLIAAPAIVAVALAGAWLAWRASLSRLATGVRSPPPE